MKTVLVTIAAIMLGSTAYAGGVTASNPDARVYFANLADGDTVSSPLTIVFGLSGMGVAPAGTDKDNTGHHHLLINRAALGQGEDGAEELSNGIPADEQHRHFGGGQTQVTLDLPKGTHTLQLVLGDLGHVPHDTPIMSKVITVSVN